jgi:hypothetical protein
MADEELILTGLAALEGLIGVLIEDAHDEAIRRAPDDPKERLARVRTRQEVGADVVALTRACEVLLRWHSEAHEAVDPS